MTATVDWKPITGARVNGTVYWLSGWKDNKPGGERYVLSGYYSETDDGWVDDDGEAVHPPTHYADLFIPAPPK